MCVCVCALTGQSVADVLLGLEAGTLDVSALVHRAASVGPAGSAAAALAAAPGTHPHALSLGWTTGGGGAGLQLPPVPPLMTHAPAPPAGTHMGGVSQQALATPSQAIMTTQTVPRSFSDAAMLDLDMVRAPSVTLVAHDNTHDNNMGRDGSGGGGGRSGSEDVLLVNTGGGGGDTPRVMGAVGHQAMGVSGGQGTPTLGGGRASDTRLATPFVR